MPFPCRSPAIPRIGRSESDLSRPRHSAAWERRGMSELASAVLRRHVGDLSAFGEWQTRGRVATWERHGMCELAFNAAGERHGICASVLRLRRLIALFRAIRTQSRRPLPSKYILILRLRLPSGPFVTLLPPTPYTPSISVGR
jgi:hypothetical protein